MNHLVDFHAVENNLRQSFRVLAGERPRCDVREVGGVTIASAGSAFQMFNAAFLAGPVAGTADFERRLLTAQVHFRARDLAWSWWVCDDWLPAPLRRHAQKFFARYGLHRAAELPGMIAANLLPPRRPLPSMEVRRVDSESERLAFCDIGSTCFHVPHAWFREIFLWDPVWRNGFEGYIGSVGGTPVATAAVVPHEGVIGIYNVATLPDFRHMGYGEAITRYAFDAAAGRTGWRTSVLQATGAGLPLYQEMGYQTVTKVTVYAT